ncbi:MAG: D-alanine--D-alanine ligase [Verrucomicrobiae bacterium]|nr:D-alanine--D-alanine ligase [Verrucomicrobiae bacterium]MDW8343684.1 D-alanine--D-alanine ligase [Verrucomicrobiae bacterium]
MIEGWHVAVLMGGVSAEREVSLRSGAAVAGALERCGARVTRVDVQSRQLELPAEVDVVFVALHGTFGEDGTVQRMLEERGLPYTFSDAAASARAFDKVRSKQAFLANEVPTPRFVVLSARRPNFSAVEMLHWPVGVKPARQGSSVGVMRVERREELPAACAEAGRYDDWLLVEEWVTGRELTVAVLEGRALPVIEVRPRDGWFDYRAKYTSGRTEYLVPAPLEEDVRRRAENLAVQAQECLGCRDLTRVDMMMDEKGRLFVLEVNTIPGFTETSLVPKAARAAGWSFERLCERLVELAAARDGRLLGSGRGVGEVEVMR